MTNVKEAWSGNNLWFLICVLGMTRYLDRVSGSESRKDLPLPPLVGLFKCFCQQAWHSLVPAGAVRGGGWDAAHLPASLPNLPARLCTGRQRRPDVLLLISCCIPPGSSALCCFLKSRDCLLVNERAIPRMESRHGFAFGFKWVALNESYFIYNTKNLSR